jgi:hypothetical protein
LCVYAVLGNECAALLRRIDVLSEIIAVQIQLAGNKRKRSLKSAGLYVIAFEKFKILVDKTFGQNFEDGSYEAAEEFRCAYFDLDISVTSKVHLVLDHVCVFCEENGCGLGVLSEHCFESLHRDFLKHLERHFVKDKENPKYGESMKKTVCEYNAGHL